MTRTAEYYDNAVYGADVLLRGTGVIGLILGDQLHPPMVADPDIWANSSRWKEGAEECVRRLARRAGIEQGDRVVDVGCGVGGATRLLRREFGARAFGLNISEEQLRTAHRLGNEDPYIKGDAHCIPLASGSVDSVLSFNMFYHIAHKRAALSEMARVTRPGGMLAFDDWVLTDQATESDRLQLLAHWNPEPVAWTTDVNLLDDMRAAGYEILCIDDYTHVGRTVMRDWFGPTFEREVRPAIVAADALHGEAVADHLRAAIDHTIELYVQRKLRYVQIVARKS